MTTIVTRLYENAAHADDVVAKLKAEGFPESTMDVIEQGGRSAEETIIAAGVPASVAQQYAQHLSVGRGLLVVRAPFVPFGAAKTAIETADMHPSFDAGVANENIHTPEEFDDRRYLSILSSHRLFLTNHLDVDNGLKPRGISAAFGIPTLSYSHERKRMRPVTIDKRFGNLFFPLLTRRGLMTKRPLIDKFFARFALPHIWNRTPRRQTSHFRLTN
ncbi:hypothetical protein KUL25_01355 [Rhodobacteraceae bacterium N5(2021)]|uniref:Uncharacterized protein n=1 Tax=Gymnodinialimonas phycosphaerae TaxID=2841589 RepID=A0A975TUZ2_9RHOB|nr:hypothetical protein [Gymnodinialimonas phycosphaerae]MBY4891405.1 hypothetical protein [Gymnodinialimonas phycosphaerae]